VAEPPPAGTPDESAPGVAPDQSGSATVPAGVAAERPAFVLHEHLRPRHHFDLRLERDGVLLSWAVPRGLPERADDRRLAIQVPDHELEHLTYQDDTKSIADTGWWEEQDWSPRRLLFALHGRRGTAWYALIRTQRDWLLRRVQPRPARSA
jgi:DNA ligase D-like protein (predicted 3'-phosphoesterase)